MTRSRFVFLASSLTLALVASPFAAGAQDIATSAIVDTTFLGTAVNLGDVVSRPSSTTFRLHIDRLTPDGEAARLASILRLRGELTLENELAGRDLGYLQLDSRFPERLAAAFLSEVDGRRHLVLITQRPFAMREIWSNARSANYRFRVVELELDANGRGEGAMLAAARFKLEKDGTLGARNLAVLPWRILNLRAVAG